MDYEITYDEIIKMSSTIQCICFWGTFHFLVRYFYFFRCWSCFRTFFWLGLAVWCYFYYCRGNLFRRNLLRNFESSSTFKAWKWSSAYRNILTHQNANFFMIQGLLYIKCKNIALNWAQNARFNIGTYIE